VRHPMLDPLPIPAANRRCRTRRAASPVPRRAVTLIEIALALFLAMLAITTVLLFFPRGIQAQMLARYHVLAAAKALELVDAYTTFHNANGQVDHEIAELAGPWDLPSDSSAMAPDLERRLSSFRFGVFPLPLEIARRIDSDGDEIAALLGEGAYIYYSQPLATSGIKESATPEAPPNEAQRLVFAVTGYAQTNVPYIFPWKAWPYYTAWPSPPINFAAGSVAKPAGRLLEDASDPDIRQVHQSTATAADPPGSRYGYVDHLTRRDRGSAIRYCQAALWYCAAKGIAPDDYADAVVDGFRLGPDERWKEVQATRFLAHAVTCLTAFHTKDQLVAGLDIPGVAVDGGGIVPATWRVTLERIATLHDSAMRLGMAFATHHPYDWSVPRPLNRLLMTDHPLWEHDLFDPAPPTGALHLAPGGVKAKHWRPIFARPVERTIGRSMSFPDKDLSTIPWGDRDHLTVTAPFEPLHRCRQLVFWAVDWQAYEDCETAPSAPVDAGKALVRATGSSWADRLGGADTIVVQDWHALGYRNPEKVIAFDGDVGDAALFPNGYVVAPDAPAGNVRVIGSVTTEGDTDPPPPLPNGRGDLGVVDGRLKPAFVGAYGADRNFNGRLDRGPLLRSTRLRAVEVARFNFYDLRVHAQLR